MVDLLLIQGLKQRDKIVFEYIFKHYYSSLCAFSMQFIKDRNLAEDFVQEFFVSLWIDATRIQINTSLKSYLFKGIKNKSLDYQKHLKVTEKYINHSLLKSDNADLSSDYYFAESELSLAIEKSLSKLAPRCREVFEMSRFAGLSNNDISTKLGISKRTVELQISNSLRILRTELSEFLSV